MKRSRDQCEGDPASSSSSDGDPVGWRHQDRQPGWHECRLRSPFKTPPPMQAELRGVPGAPKKRRIVRRTPESEESPVAKARRTKGLLWAQGSRRQRNELFGQETEEDEDDTSGTDGSCSSFVVDDDDPSLVDECVASERRLERAALLEWRATLVGRMNKLQRRLVSVESQLRELGCFSFVGGEHRSSRESTADSVPFRVWEGTEVSVPESVY